MADSFYSISYNHSTIQITSGIPIDEAVQRRVDVCLALLCILCMLLGVPGNLLALVHFVSEYSSLAKHEGRRGGAGSKKAFFTDIYLVIAVCDLVVCSSLPAQVEGYFSGRDSPVLFSNTVFCNIWGALWEVLPYFSVFLVGCLSISRLLTLLYPLVRFSRGVTAIVFIAYLAQLILTRLVPILTDNGHFKYGSDVNYCFLRADNWMFLSITCAVQMALPILPIFISCLISIYKLCSLKKLGTGSSRKHNSATVTVIIFTLIYIVYNIPIFLNYVYFVKCWVERDKSYLEHYQSPFMYWYSWNITFIICIAMNSASNPILYFFRMSSFKAFVLRRRNEGRGLYKQLSEKISKSVKSSSSKWGSDTTTAPKSPTSAPISSPQNTTD